MTEHKKYPDLYKAVLKIKQRQFEEKGGYAMYNSMLDEAFANVLSLAKSDELNSKIDTLNEKVTNMTATIDGNDSSLEQETELVPAWQNNVVDLSFLSPEDKENYDNFCSQNNLLTAQLNDLYLNIEDLNKQRAEAIKNYDISAVVDIDERLLDLNKQYKSKYNESLEFKSKVQGSRDEWEKNLSDLKEVLKDEKWEKSKSIDKSKYAPSVLKEYKQNKTVELVKSFIDDFPKDQAKILLNNNRIKDMLGESYNKVLKEYM